MLKSIHINGTFGHRDSFFEFHEGLTAITGRNGMGKSMIQEMIQFAYFGLAALRGISSDYPELEVTLKSWIKGRPYTIKRTITKALIFVGHGEDMIQYATGTKAVNIAVRELFGYSMAVFQVANAVNQKKVDEFCSLLPTARKKLVDETIGLSALDDLSKWIAEQELGLRSRISARAELLRPPVEPTFPDGYKPAEELTTLLEPLLVEQRARIQFEVAANQEVVFPQEVNLESDDDRLEEYKAKAAQYQALLTEAQLLQKDIAALPALIPFTETVLEPDDAKLEEYQTTSTRRAILNGQISAAQSDFGRTVETSFTLTQVEAMEAVHTLRRRWNEKKALEQAGVAYHCENCQHDGHMVDARVTTEYGDVPEQAPEAPELTEHSLVLTRRILDQMPRRLELAESIKKLEADRDELPDTDHRIVAISATRKAFAAQANAKTVQARHDELAVKRADLNARIALVPDTAPDVSRIEVKRQQSAIFLVKAQAALELRVKVMNAQEELAKFSPDLDTTIITLQAARMESSIYEANLTSYLTAKNTFDQEMIHQNALHAECEDWGNAKQAVIKLRTRVKGYLLPSLNKVASYLLSEFTGGALTWIVINDDFEVIVDGKRVETLSGGQKTVANLAIRIGLGQVLTNQVFPVLMLDEPDESCDDIVAEHIERTLGVLKTKMGQILLVTHKTGRASDNRIHLE